MSTYVKRAISLCDRHTFSVADWTASYLDGEISAESLMNYAAEVFHCCTGSGRDCTAGASELPVVSAARERVAR